MKWRMQSLEQQLLPGTFLAAEIQVYKALYSISGPWQGLSSNVSGATNKKQTSEDAPTLTGMAPNSCFRRPLNWAWDVLEPLPSPCAGRNHSTRPHPAALLLRDANRLKSHNLHMVGAVWSTLLHEPRREIFSCHIKIPCDWLLCLSWAHILLSAYILCEYSFLHRFWFHIFITTQKLTSVQLILASFPLLIIDFFFFLRGRI